MVFRNYNDYEIVNLIKQGNEEAFDFMVSKYEYFIAKKIRKFNLTKNYEDMVQESLMVLYKSIMRFDSSYNKSFMRYFELNLTNRFITIKNKVNKRGEFLANKLPTLYCDIIKEEPKYYLSDQEIYSALDTLSKFEKKVFQLKIIEKKNIDLITKILNCKTKKIYNALDRIKNKIKMHLM
ncbi:hypothetical protein ACAG96_05010 [Candidatus Izemoplasma sp. B36]|uniref:hypothetical protein n=1 Tax=Candidatus Izemoplasma sp. B36 TaxID=3242468 RepID=UPI0035590A8C